VAQMPMLNATPDGQMLDDVTRGEDSGAPVGKQLSSCCCARPRDGHCRWSVSIHDYRLHRRNHAKAEN
jgi:hypothetical protein